MFDLLWSAQNFDRVWHATGQTLYLLLISGLISIPIGTILGLWMALCGKGRVFEQRWASTTLSFIMGVIRSIPFILLMIIVIPLSRTLFHVSVGITPSLISLSIIGIATVSRVVEQTLVDLNPNIYETAHALGTTKSQLIVHFVLNEARVGLILGYTSSLISLLAYSTVVYIIGGGGLGHTGIQIGYFAFGIESTQLMWMSVIMMIILVQSFQLCGSLLAYLLDKKRKDI